MLTDTVSRDTLLDLELSLIDPDPDQPRKHFDAAKLAELAESMQTDGLAVPIMVRPAGERFIIVHGERRYRAALSLGRSTIRAEIRSLEPDKARWLALIENVQRADLTPIEEAREYQRRLFEDMTQEQLAQRIGKTRSYIAQKLRLLTLPQPIMLYIERGALTEGHARQLLKLRRVYSDLKYDFGYREDAEKWPETLADAWHLLGTALLDDLRPCAYPPFWFRWLVGAEPGGMKFEDWPVNVDSEKVQPLDSGTKATTLYRRIETDDPIPDQADELSSEFKVFKARFDTLMYATREFWRYAASSKGIFPAWESAAFWWASLAVMWDTSVVTVGDWVDGDIMAFNSSLAGADLYLSHAKTKRQITLKQSAERRKKGEEALIWDWWLADLEQRQALSLLDDKKRIDEALQAIGGMSAPLRNPSYEHWGPKNFVSRDTQESDQHVH